MKKTMVNEEFIERWMDVLSWSAITFKSGQIDISGDDLKQMLSEVGVEVEEKEGEVIKMGDRYAWVDKCPNCPEQIQCYYAESCGFTDVKCPFCKKEFDLVMDFKLVPKCIKSDK